MSYDELQKKAEEEEAAEEEAMRVSHDRNMKKYPSPRIILLIQNRQYNIKQNLSIIMSYYC
jgi:hypothetical protein